MTFGLPETPEEREFRRAFWSGRFIGRALILFFLNGAFLATLGSLSETTGVGWLPFAALVAWLYLAVALRQVRLGQRNWAFHFFFDPVTRARLGLYMRPDR